ncbi:MAG: serine protease [Rubrivivax sp.]
MKAAAANTPVRVGEPKPGQSIVVKRFLMLPTDAKVGDRQSGLLCGNDSELRFTEDTGSFILRNAGAVVRRELDLAGYPRVVESAFDAAASRATVEYELAATLTDMQMTLCGGPAEFRGGLWLQMDWELFSPRERKVVYRATHAGSFHTAGAGRVDITEMVRRAVSANARNLLADTAFVEHATRRAQGGGGDPQPALAIVRRLREAGGVQQRMPELQSAVATVFSGAGHGSGFYIHADGYLLTNRHVVGDSKFVKVKLASGRELLGEVLRSDPGRDVALLRTEAVTLMPMAVSTAEPRTGDEVYALGSPLGDALAGTVTRGVLSSTREIEQRRWLQSDVRVLPGSSGGPLVAADGAVIGIAAAGLGGGSLGVNLFVPIREALSVLKLELQPDS